MASTASDYSSGDDQMPRVILRGGRGKAVVYEHGAHVTSWCVDDQEQLFVSKQAIFKPPKAIRGGIPGWPYFTHQVNHLGIYL